MNKKVLRILLAAVIAISAIISLSSCDMLPAELQDMLGLSSGECRHTNVDWVTDVAATCKLEGKNHSVCSDCGEVVEYGTIPVVDHVLGEWEIDYESTCSNQGSKYKKCLTCKSRVITEALPLSDAHSYELGVCLNCRAAQPASTGLVFLSLGNGTCSVSGMGSCTDTSIVIPETSPDGERVVRIETGAFLYQASITSVVIPGSVTGVGINVFTGCSLLKASVPAAAVPSVKCDSITELTITGGGAIPASAMMGAPNLSRLIMKEGVTEVGDSAFAACAMLTSISMPSTLTTIGNSSFSRCQALKKVVLGSGVVTIGDQAFANSQSLMSINIPASVKYIGAKAFTSFAAADRENKSSLEKVEFEVTEGWYTTSDPTATDGFHVDPAMFEDDALASAALNSTYGDYYIKRN